MPRARFAFDGIREVVHFVENQQREPRTPPLEQRECRVVRGDRERTHLLLVAVIRTDAVDAERVGELREPLGDERSCRRDDACAGLQLVDCEERDEGLASAGWQDDCPARARCAPAIDRLALVGTWRTRVEQRRIELVRRRTFGDAMRGRPRTQLGEPVTGRDERIETRVVDEPRRSLVGGNSAKHAESEAVRQ